jgi:arylsulfatase A
VESEGYLPDVLTDKAISFMQADSPFFTMIAYNTPHSPFQVPDRYFDKYKAKGLNDKDACVYGMVENIDDNMGRLMDFLEKSGKIENTIVIFMTDNGPNGLRYNGGMKGKKADLDEGGVRVPFFMKVPGYSHQLIKPWAAHIDILPTLADLLELEVQDDLEIHGKSLKPLIEERGLWEDRFFFTHHVHLQFDTIPGAIRNQEYLLTLKNKEKELYQLLEDPFQKNNILASAPEIADQLEMNYLDWLKKMTVNGVEPPLIQIGHPDVPQVDLPAPDGKRSGKVGFKGEMGWANDWFVGFEDPDDQVFWELEAVEEGEYAIFALMANEGPLKLRLYLNGMPSDTVLEEAHEAELIPNRDRVPRGEVEEFIWPEIPLGRIKFEKGKQHIKLGLAENAKNSFNLKGLILKKIPS